MGSFFCMPQMAQRKVRAVYSKCQSLSSGANCEKKGNTPENKNKEIDTQVKEGSTSEL